MIMLTREPPDHCSAYAAGLLAVRLEQFWTERGYPKIRCEVIQTTSSEVKYLAAYGVRSNMVNGLPPT
jgi:hypothetical protein